MEFKSPHIHRTPLYRAKAAYANMKRRCANGAATETAYAGVELRMTINDWLAWALPLYEEFCRERPDDQPCAARKGDAGHYEIGNIEVVSTADNRRAMKTTLVLREDGTKLCPSCRRILTAAAFSKNRARPDGLQTECKPCHNRR